MAEVGDVPETFGAAPRKGHSDEVKEILRELDELVDELFSKDMEPAILRARVALGLNQK